MNYRLGIFGIGTMGQAILSRILEEKKLSPNEVIVYDVNAEKMQEFAKKFRVAASPQEIADQAQYVLFAVKPQHFPSVTSVVSFSEKNTVISIMAGVTIETLRSNLNYPCPVVRVMPNTPCKLGKGVMGVHADNVSKEDERAIYDLLKSCGEIVPIEEKYFDAVTSVSGSGPAYVYMFLQGMIQGGMEGGLTFEQSKTLALETMIGTAEMVRNAEEDIDTLIDKVCSKGGTTIEAVQCYREKDLVKTIALGIEKCRLRSLELGKKL